MIEVCGQSVRPPASSNHAKEGSLQEEAGHIYVIDVTQVEVIEVLLWCDMCYRAFRVLPVVPSSRVLPADEACRVRCLFTYVHVSPVPSLHIVLSRSSYSVVTFLSSLLSR